MRLLLAADIFPPESGGPATYVVTLANELTKLGVSVTIVSLNPASDISVLAPGIKLYPVKFKFKLFRYVHYYLLLKRESKNCDLVYAMGPVNAGCPALKAARKARKKFVVKVVGDYAWERYQSSDFGLLSKDFVSVDQFQKLNIAGKIGKLQKIERQVVAAADLVITPSSYLKNIVVGWGANPNKVQTIYNAVEFKDVFATHKPDRELWIVTVARLVKWKGINTLIDLMPEVLKQVPNAKLKIVGGGPEYGHLHAQVSNLNLSEQVELVGNLPHDQALAYVKASDLFVLNSGYEGLSHAILEALYYNKPVLASRVGGNPEVVTKPENLFTYNQKTELTKQIVGQLREPSKITAGEDFAKFTMNFMLTATKRALESL